ncbi:calpastatin isoform X5 [Podarcis raffonei]|uniref:calpastatin isoform X5 n=1 Tax=Podarcis raffonei TaxID=65483 RepID=UPI002329596B|nr:calpastatin isoform X5 [Podarcis raffonei]
MSQPQKGKKTPAKEGRSRGPKNASGSSGDKKGAEAVEKKPESTSLTESPKTQTSGTSSISKAQSSSTVSSKAPTMKPSETKASSSQQKASGVESHKRKRNKKQAAQKAKAEAEKAAQLAKPDDSQTKGSSEEKQKEPGGAKSQSKPVVEPKQSSTGKVPSGQIDKTTTQLTSKEEPKAKPDDKSLPTKAAVAASGTAGAVAAAGLTVAAAETKEGKLPAPAPAAAESKPAEKSDIDAALDDLIDTLGGPEENEPPTPEYTGPTVSDPMSSLYIEELGKRESTIPPEYRKLLEGKGDGKAVPLPVAVGESQPTMTDDDLADALSSDFTCSAVTSAGEKKDLPKEKPAEEGELLQAQSASLISSSAPPKEKKARMEEAALSDSALDALVDTLGMPEPEPEVDLSSIVEVEEPKAKERKEKKPGERDDTIPPEYRLKPELDKDGKPLLPKPEEKPKPLSDSDLADEFSKDFACPTPPAEIPKPSTPADVPKKSEAAEPPKTPKENVATSPAVPSVQPSAPSGVSTKPSAAESKKISTEKVVSAAAAPSVASSAPSVTSPTSQVPDEALEALSGSLGKVEPQPEEKKPAVDKVKEKAKQEEREKLGEDEETIPPDYRLTEAKDKDGKPLLPKPQEKPQPLSESELIDALSEGFSSSSAPTSKAAPTAAPQKPTGAGKPAVAPTEEVISSASASAVHSSAPPPPAATPGRKELDDAADLLADSLGQREPDPDENKPLVDKIKEKAKSEHRDKLGEKDETIPPDYRHLLDSDEKGKPTGKDAEKPKEQKKPADDSAAIDALSGDFDHCGKPPVSQPSTKDEKTKDAATSKPARKDEKKSKSRKAKEQSSSAKSEKQKKS